MNLSAAFGPVTAAMTRKLHIHVRPEHNELVTTEQTQKEYAMSSAFAGIRVLELGQIYNGPYCGLLLAQLGADVVKIEPPNGEMLRFRSHQVTESHEFLMLNSNKRSVVLDLKSSEGHENMLELIRTADVLIENYAPGTMDRLELNFEKLRELNPRLIVASGKGYGSTGPYAHMSAMDITVQAMSGSISSTGTPDGPPTKSGLAFVDFSGGVHLFAAIAAALYQREHTGKGQIVEVSMHDTIYPMLASGLGGLHNSPDRKIPERTGNRHSGLAIAPYNVYPSSDGWIALICMAERHWHGVIASMGQPELGVDPRFVTEADRVENMDEVDEMVAAWTATLPRDVLIAELQAAGVPCAPVKSLEEVDTDEHLIARGMIRYVEHPMKGRTPVPGCALQLSDSPLNKLDVAPPLGNATDEILDELRKSRAAYLA
ncbi:CoA transferase [Rhodococcus sp. 1168]|uniref:CaiB/BaiF CoA transferase family protein n=1 Tax=Rhodococcus sp. 1168 TaxID=2018041 RepID=UPI0020CB60F3|nr:CoA transferase [Rhodococcus sp. 1168]